MGIAARAARIDRNEYFGCPPKCWFELFFSLSTQKGMTAVRDGQYDEQRLSDFDPLRQKCPFWHLQGCNSYFKVVKSSLSKGEGVGPCLAHSSCFVVGKSVLRAEPGLDLRTDLFCRSS